MSIALKILTQALTDIEPFSRLVLRRPLRRYQIEPARQIIRSIIALDGNEILLRFPRQSGKNETIGHVQTYTLFLFQRIAGSFVHVAPTYEPQAHTALKRVLELTAGNPFFKNLTRSGNTLTFGRMSGIYLSGLERDKPNVGLTASRALFKDEAQDLNQTYVERTFDPMVVNTNAPMVYTGTARHTATYLARKRLQLEQIQDTRPRIFIINWRDVEKENPSYGRAVRQQIATKGALHPAVLTEFENVETADTGRLFDERRISLVVQSSQLRTQHSALSTPCVATLDVGGASLIDGHAGQHDFTVCALHAFTVGDDKLNTFTTTDYATFKGANLLDDTPARARLCAYLDAHRPTRIVVDSTGLGAGLASFLTKRYPFAAIPFSFNARSKTELLAAFLALIETGHYRHYTQINGRLDEDRERLLEQMRRCEYIQHGPNIEWGVASSESWVNPITARIELLHDDHLIANALLGVLKDATLRTFATAVNQDRPRRRGRADD